MLVQSIREGLLALRALGTPLTPFWLTVLFLWLPRWLTVILFQSLLRTRMAVLGIDPHLGDDLEELRQMAREIMAQLSSLILRHTNAESPAAGSLRADNRLTQNGLNEREE